MKRIIPYMIAGLCILPSCRRGDSRNTVTFRDICPDYQATYEVEEPGQPGRMRAREAILTTVGRKGCWLSTAVETVDENNNGRFEKSEVDKVLEGQ